MSSKDLGLRIAGTIFGIVAVLHLLRLATRIHILIGDCPLPVWINWAGLIATAFLCAWLWWLSVKG